MEKNNEEISIKQSVNTHEKFNEILKRIIKNHNRKENLLLNI